MFALYSTPLYIKNDEVYTKMGLDGCTLGAIPVEYNDIEAKEIHCAFSELFTDTMMIFADSLFYDLYESLEFINGSEEDEHGNLIEIMSAYIIDHDTANDLCKHTDVPVA